MVFFSSRKMARSKVQPTHYPRIPFHFLRSAQLLAAVVVTCVMAFFVDQLHHDGYPIPWTFLLVRASGDEWVRGIAQRSRVLTVLCSS